MKRAVPKRKKEKKASNHQRSNSLIYPFLIYTVHMQPIIKDFILKHFHHPYLNVCHKEKKTHILLFYKIYVHSIAMNKFSAPKNKISKNNIAVAQ